MFWSRKPKEKIEELLDLLWKLTKEEKIDWKIPREFGELMVKFDVVENYNIVLNDFCFRTRPKIAIYDGEHIVHVYQEYDVTRLYKLARKQINKKAANKRVTNEQIAKQNADKIVEKLLEVLNAKYSNDSN